MCERVADGRGEWCYKGEGESVGGGGGEWCCEKAEGSVRGWQMGEGSGAVGERRERRRIVRGRGILSGNGSSAVRE